jgi:HD-like signal output (HDOD) protein
MLDWLQRLFQSAAQETQEPQPPADSSQDSNEPAVPEDGSDNVSLEHFKIVDAEYFNWLFGKTDALNSRLYPIEQKMLDALAQLAQSKQPADYLVKRMPGVAPQLMQILRRDNFSGAEMAEKISHDVVLVQALLRLANSVRHHSGQNIVNIEQAVLFVGQEHLRQLLMSVMFRPIINLNSGYYTRLAAQKAWEQSERSADLCRTLAGNFHAELIDAFLSGLLQNIGMSAVLSVADRIAHGEATPIPSTGFCHALLGHAQTLTCNIAREWHISEDVVHAIEVQDNTKDNDALLPLGKTLRLGNYLSKAQILMENDLLNGYDAIIEEVQKFTSQNLELNLSEPQ